MAVNFNNYSKWSSSDNAYREPGSASYKDTTETLAALKASAYFDTLVNAFPNDLMVFLVGSDGADLVRVTSVTGATPVTVAAFIDAGDIADGSVTNVKVNTAAAIEYSKMEAVTDGSILVGDAANEAAPVVMSGDVAIINSGATTIQAGAVDNAKVNTTAAIEYSKMEAVTDGSILVGDASNEAAPVVMSGDVAIINSGATTIQAAAIDLAMLSAGITPSHVVKFAGEITWSAGGASLATTVTGALASDIVIASIQAAPSEAGYIASAAVTANTVTLVLSTANTSNDAVVSYQVLRAAA